MDVGRSYGLGIEVLNNSSYKVWRLVWSPIFWVKICGTLLEMKVLLRRMLVSKKWKIKNSKAEFVLKMSICWDLFEHIIGYNSACGIWSNT